MKYVTALVISVIFITLSLIPDAYLFIQLLIIFPIAIYLINFLKMIRSKQRKSLVINQLIYTLLFIWLYCYAQLLISQYADYSQRDIAFIEAYYEENNHYPSKETLMALTKFPKKGVVFYDLLKNDESTEFSYMYKSALNPFDKYYYTGNGNWQFLPD